MKRRASKHIEPDEEESVQNDWSLDIEVVLDKIRINCVILSKEHKTKYLYLKGILRYFRVPVILISSIASVSSVGLQTYLDQQLISAITCLLSLTCGIIGSIELFLAIQSRMENELMASKDYYILSIEIFKVLKLDRENRSIKGKTFLEASYGTYVKLIENSNIIDKKISDSLTNIEKNTKYANGIDSISSDTPPPSLNNSDIQPETPVQPKSSVFGFFENSFFKKPNIEINNSILPSSSIDDIIGISNKKTLNLYNPSTNILKHNKWKKNTPINDIITSDSFQLNNNLEKHDVIPNIELSDNIGISGHNLIDLEIEDLYPIKNS